MLSKMSAYVKSYDGKTKWMGFLLKMSICWKNIMIFGIKSVIVLKKNMTMNQSVLKKIFFDNDKDFHSRKIPEPGSNYVCSSVILIDSVLKK